MAGLTGKRYDFTADNAGKAPNKKGVYQIEQNDGTLVFIGQGIIRERLQSHLRKENDADPCIFRNAPDVYRREVCANAESRERELLRQNSTLCNRRVG